MNMFDRQQIGFLEPLLKYEVVLHFSFYANTFPIVYHYNLLLEQEKRTKKGTKDFIKPRNWNDAFPSKSSNEIYKIKTQITKDKWQLPDKINLFYTSDIDCNAKYPKKENPYKIIESEIFNFKPHENIEFIEFSNYCPLFVFLNNNLYTHHLHSSLSPHQSIIEKIQHLMYSTKPIEVYTLAEHFPLLSTLLKEAKHDGIEYLCVYTDTVNEAKDIIEEYNWGDKVCYFDKENIASLKLQNEHKNESKALNIYFYSAPTTFHFLKQTERFVPFLLDPAKQSSGIKTYACLHYNNEIHNNAIANISKELTAYHENLFNTAYSKKGAEYLNNARLAYNKYSTLIRHDSFFYSPESFSNCIALHHVNKNKNQEYNYHKKEQNEAPSGPTANNIHIHYGAGKLGIGLVLPLIKPNAGGCNQLIVIQKNRDEWNRKVKTDLKRITLSNTDGWELKLDLKILNTSEGFPDQDCFFLFENISSVGFLLQKATSISYSLNDQEIEKDFLKLIACTIDKDVLVFPFENKPFGTNSVNHKEELCKIISDTPKLKYIKLKADRICLARTFDLDNKVNVICEKHIEIILNIEENKTNSLFDKSRIRSNQIVFTEDTRRYKFLSDRKEYLVNELHFILAVYGYSFLLLKGIMDWENQFITIIQSALTSDHEYKIPIDTFIRLQIIRLLQYPSAVLKDEYNLEEENAELIYEHLLKYAKGVTERFNASKEDLISRVFNTNDETAIERKYNTIIKVIEEFVYDNKAYIENIPLLSAGTYLEYKELIQDIKNKIEHIFHTRITNFNRQVNSMKKEQNKKQLELESFECKVKSLTKKSENILVLFDVDGTIFKAKEIFLPAIKTVLSENNITDFDDDKCLKFVGMPYNEIEDDLQKLILKTSYKQFKLRLQQLELENIRNFGELFDGVIDTLKILQQKNYTLAICTNAREEYINAIIEKFNLLQFFDEKDILFPEKSFPPSDKQTMLRELKNKRKPFKCYMIGDRYYDSEAAKKNGFEFIGAMYGYANDEIKNETKHLIGEIRNIVSIIKP